MSTGQRPVFADTVVSARRPGLQAGFTGHSRVVSVSVSGPTVPFRISDVASAAVTAR